MYCYQSKKKFPVITGSALLVRLCPCWQIDDLNGKIMTFEIYLSYPGNIRFLTLFKRNSLLFLPCTKKLLLSLTCWSCDINAKLSIKKSGEPCSSVSSLLGIINRMYTHHAELGRKLWANDFVSNVLSIKWADKLWTICWISPQDFAPIRRRISIYLNLFTGDSTLDRTNRAKWK